MNTTTYLKQLLTFTPYILSDEDSKLSQRDMKAYIIQKIFRKKFRKQKIFDKTLEDISARVAISIKDNKPLFFAIPFGGYKHFWNPSHPEPDWAELFSFKFFTEWLAPIIAVYKPGVIIEFISEDMILPRMNNYPPESLDAYAKVFTALVAAHQQILPENFQLRFWRVGDKYDKEKITADVESMLPNSWKQWETYTPEQKAIELKRSKRSIFWNGREDWTKLTSEEKEKKIIESRLIELAYYTIEAKPEYLGDYYMEDNHVGVCFSFGNSPDNFESRWITLGTTYASTVDYWIGRGILERKGEEFVNRIVSKEQYEKIKNTLQVEAITIDSLPFKNYQSIEVVSSEDWKSIIEK